MLTNRNASKQRTTVIGLAAAFLLLLSACGASGGAESLGSESNNAATATTDQKADVNSDGVLEDDHEGDAPAIEEQPAAGEQEEEEVVSDGDVPSEGDAEWGADNNCSIGQFDNVHAEYVVGNIPDNDPDGGLVVRLLPGADGPRSKVLPAGTDVMVDPDLNGNICIVIGSSVWWHLAPSPELAVGGWVNSAYVYDISGETDEGIGDEENTGEDDFDVELAQIECIYNDSAQACDLLTLFVAGVDDNYGLGNSYSMAPSEFLASDCLVDFDQIACAELRFRGPGGDIGSIANSFVAAYQSGDVAGQQGLSGPRQTVINSSGAIENTDPGVDVGVSSLNADGNEFSWTVAPTIVGRCIVESGLVHGCAVSGD